MTSLADLVYPDNSHIRDAAINLDIGLGKPGYVQSYTPTQSAIRIFTHLAQAVLPDTPRDKRAMNWYGSYGSGKSHLGVVVGRLLREGVGSAEFTDLLTKLKNLGYTGLSQQLHTTFLDPKKDPDARPYLLVSLNTTGGQSIPHQLLEALYKTLQDEPHLSGKDILSKTEYDAAHERFLEIIQRSPDYKNAELSAWSLNQDYLTTADMADDLLHHVPTAYTVFQAWHEQVCHGAPFDPSKYGGKKFIEAYLAAGAALSHLGYAGIAILWDEFGHTLEELLNSTTRNAIAEIKELQDFVERTGNPEQGHVLFITLTHVSLGEYGSRSQNASEDVQNRLKTIEGRFSAIKVELKPSEVEGYHLLGAQLHWTDTGNTLLQSSQTARETLKKTCQQLSLFRNLTDDMDRLIKDCYPLHPITAAGLFAISTRYAQAARTAFTFFRDLQTAGVFARDIDLEQGLFRRELIRFPELLEYYQTSLERYSETDILVYRRALSEIRAKQENAPERDAILGILLLSKLLGDNFQATETFLAAALYDTYQDDPKAIELQQHLNWLKNTGLIWKNDLTEVWSLAGEAGVDVETLIDKKLDEYKHQKSVEDVLKQNTDMRDDLFPHLGEHDLEPSPCGIVRSYNVRLLTPPLSTARSQTSLSDSYVAALYLVLAADEATATQTVTQISQYNRQPIYYWIPKSGIAASGLLAMLWRYLAIQSLMNEESSAEGLKRQLLSKWEKNRQDIINVLGELFGRKGLEFGKAIIIRAGDATPLACKSWHQFRTDLARSIQQDYTKEVHVRNMNLNKVCNEDYMGRKLLTDIIQKILDFADNAAFQDDLLGEKETSESAAIIDGILGANNLFSERAGGWDIKKVSETEGALQDILNLIHSEFLKARNGSFKTVNLRTQLMSAPYGLPPVSIALFAAVALRHDQKRLSWQGASRNKSFAESLSRAFEQNASSETRLEDFTDHQKRILTLLGLCLPDSFRTYDPKQAVHHLYQFLKTLPTAVATSNKLKDTTRQLFDMMRQDKTAHQLADWLLTVTPAASEFPRHKGTEDCKLTYSCIANIFESFEQLLTHNYHEIKVFLLEQLKTVDDQSVLLTNLEQSSVAFDIALYKLLSRTPQTLDQTSVSRLAEVALERTLEECDENRLGQLTAILRTAIDTHKVSKDHEKREALHAILTTSLTTVEDRSILLTNLSESSDPKIKALAKLIVEEAYEQDEALDKEALDNFVLDYQNKPVSRTTLLEIGQMTGQIKDWIQTNRFRRPSREERLRDTLKQELTKLGAEYPVHDILADWKLANEEPRAIATLADALNRMDDEALDALVNCWVEQPLALCDERVISQFISKLNATFTRQIQITKNAQYFLTKISPFLAAITDKTILLRNLASEGSELASALADWIESNHIEQLYSLIQLGSKKGLENCRTIDMDSLLQRLNTLIQNNKFDRDLREQAFNELKTVLQKHKALEASELITILNDLLGELRMSRS